MVLTQQEAIGSVKRWIDDMWKEKRRRELEERKSRRRSRITSVLLPPVKPPLNGKREVARRLRQIAAGQIKVG